MFSFILARPLTFFAPLERPPGGVPEGVPRPPRLGSLHCATWPAKHVQTPHHVFLKTVLTYLCDTGYRISHDSRFCAFDFSQLNPSAPPLPQSKHFPLDITPSLPLLFSTSALPQFTFSRQQDGASREDEPSDALPQFTFSRQQDPVDDPPPSPPALPQFTFSRQQDGGKFYKVVFLALPQFTFSRQQDDGAWGVHAGRALPQFTFSRQQD